MSARKLLPGLIAAAVLAGCGNDMGDLQQYVAEVKSRKTTEIEPIPQIVPYQAFAYVPGDRRDPFTKPEGERDQTALANAGGSGIRPDLNRNREPLEEFPLDSLRMVGTIQTGRATYALVKAPDNVINRVTLGDHMGQNFGKITRISESEIELVEIIPDGFGGWMQRPAVLALTEK